MRLFGFEISRDRGDRDNIPAVTPDVEPGEDAVGDQFAWGLDIGSAPENLDDLIGRYRAMELIPTCDQAVDDIVCEAVVADPNGVVVGVDASNMGLDGNTEKAVVEEFDKILSLLNFNNAAYDVFRRWYVDGRIAYEAVIDRNDTGRGLVELRNIDPRRIRPVRLERKAPMPSITNSTWPAGMSLRSWSKRFFVYSESPMRGGSFHSQSDPLPRNSVYMTADSILYCTSGVMNADNTHVIGHLHRAMKTANQLEMLEDATVIYRVTRAPERLIFYIDVGNLPKAKAEQHMNRVIAKYKNKDSYDPATGKYRTARHQISMLENYYLPRREGGRSTEITTYPVPCGSTAP